MPDRKESGAMWSRINNTNGNLRKLLYMLLAALVAVPLVITVVAQMPGDSTVCPNHTEHDEACGYVEAQEEIPCDQNCEADENGEIIHAEECSYRPAQEGSPCTHSCELCDPAGEISPGAVEFDKNPESAGYADVELFVELNSDQLNEIAAYIGGEEAPAILSEGTDYTLETDEEGGELKITLKKEWIAEQPVGVQRLELQFMSGAQEVSAEIADSTPAEEPDGELPSEGEDSEEGAGELPSEGEDSEEGAGELPSEGEDSEEEAGELPSEEGSDEVVGEKPENGLKVSPDTVKFDKNPENADYADVELFVELNSDQLNEIAAYVAGKEAPEILSEGTDYTLETNGEDGQLKITLKKEWLAEQPVGVQRLELQFAGGVQEVSVQISDNAFAKEPDGELPYEGEESVAEDGEENSELLAKAGAYEVVLSADSVEEDAEFINLVSQTTGILSISVNLPKGETGRYIDVYMPDYGFSVGSPLPSTDGNITEITTGTRSVEVAGSSQTVDYVRLAIADSVDSTLNVQIPYTTKMIGAWLDILWGKAGTLPETGFTVTVYNSENRELATKTYGSWEPEKVNGQAGIELSQNKDYDIYAISNYPDALDSSGQPRMSGQSYTFRVTAFNAYYPNTSGEQYRKETPYKVKIYVPDPDLITVTDINGGGIDFEGAQLQSDGTDYWYELEFGMWSDEWLSGSDYTYGSYGQYNNTSSTSVLSLSVIMEKADGAAVEAGQSFTVKPLELTTRAYGESDLHTYYAEWTPSMRWKNEVTGTSNSFRYCGYYGGESIPATGNGGSSTNAFVIDPGSSYSHRVIGPQVSGIDVNGLASSLYGGQSNKTHDNIYPSLEGSTEEWTFPYEIQPSALKYQLGYVFDWVADRGFYWQDIPSKLGAGDLNDLVEVRYGTSGGEEYMASLRSENTLLYVEFDQVPEGERVVSARTTWKKWPQSFSTMDVYLNYEVPETGEDGLPLPSSGKYQVKHVWRDGEDTVLSDSENILQTSHTHIWFVTRPQRCPGLYWTPISNKMDTVVMDDEKRYKSEFVLKVPDAEQKKDAVSYRDTMSDPKLRLGMMLEKPYVYSGGFLTGWAGDVQMDTQYLTGKMTVMPFLSGWTVTYHTVNKGEQTYTIPDEIPEEGMEIQIPLEAGDRFDKMIVFSKEGEVSGWSAYPELIKDIEYAFWRTAVDGGHIMKNAGSSLSSASEGIYKARFYGYISYGDCDQTDGNHQGMDDIYGIASTHSAGSSNVGFCVYNIVFRIGSLNSNTYAPEISTSVTVEDVYQGEETLLNIRGVNFAYLQAEYRPYYWHGGGLPVGLVELINELYGVSGISSNFNTVSFTVPYESRPVFYVELLSEDVVYMGSDISTKFGNLPRTSTTAGVEYLELDDGSLWLKITPDEIAQNAGSDTTNGMSDWRANYSSWELQTALYALPGAKTGNMPVIGDVYMDLGVQELMERFDGTNEEYPYLEYRFTGLVPDTRGVLQDGDNTTNRLYRLKQGETKINVLQQVFSGVSLIPGSSYHGLAVESRVTEVHNHDIDGLRTLVSVGSANENLTNYEVVLEIPKKGKEITGTQTGGIQEGTVESQFDMRLLRAPEVASNSTSSTPEFAYRLIGSSDWISADQVTEWGQVDAIRVRIEKLEAVSILNMNLYMDMDAQQTDGISSYIGGSYSYESSSGQKSQGTIMLGGYTFRTYKLSGNVWYDLNENGLKSGTKETGMEGVTVMLKRAEDDSTVATEITDENGEFIFEAVEGDGLYMEIALPEGHKLTKMVGAEFTSSATDSDFDRSTNRLTLPEVLRNGTYTNVSAGLVKLPVITAPDIEVIVDETAPPEATVQWDYGAKKPQYEAAEDTSIATVTPEGVVSGLQEGETKASVWVENTLGDRVEAEYKITVKPQVVGFTLTKTLTSPAEKDETFVFEVNGAGKVFYVTVTVQEGSSSGQAVVENLGPGTYKVTELDTNWRYGNTGEASQSQELTDHTASYTFTFTNSKDSEQWTSGSDKVTNTMKDTQETP